MMNERFMQQKVNPTNESVYPSDFGFKFGFELQHIPNYNTLSVSKRDTDILLGRYWANISDTLLVGELHQWKERELTAVVHKSGWLSLVCSLLVLWYH